MQFKIINEKQNPLLKRKELTLEMDYDGATPSKAVLQQMLAKEFKAEPNHVEIAKIISLVGKDSGTIWMKIWQEKEIEIYKEKNAPKEEVAEPKEEVVKEKSAEEPKEEKPVEPEKKEGEQ